MAGTELVELTQAERALSTVETPQDAKVLYDKLEALSQYAKRYGVDTDKQNEIARVKLETARKGGQILSETVTRGGSKSRGASLPEGISKDQSSRWQKLARIPSDVFYEKFDKLSEGDDVVTLAAFLGGLYSSDTPEWATPQDLFDELDAEFGFTLDVCATDGNAKCETYYTESENGLTQPWSGTCWMNPPYGRVIADWMAKALGESQSGVTVVCLVPARVDTDWWWDYSRRGEVRFLHGRLKFGDADSGAPFPSAVVVFGPTVTPKTVYWER